MGEGRRELWGRFIHLLIKELTAHAKGKFTKGHTIFDGEPTFQRKVIFEKELFGGFTGKSSVLMSMVPAVMTKYRNGYINYPGKNYFVETGDISVMGLQGCGPGQINPFGAPIWTVIGPSKTLHLRFIVCKN